MKKGDKLIVVFGVIILIIAGLGIYIWVEEPTEEEAQLEDFFVVTGVMKDLPNAITIPDSCAFYALVATPIAVNYNSEGEQKVIPLYIKNFEDPSRAVIRAEEMIGITVNEVIQDTKSVKDVSLELAEKYWESSEGVLIIENSQEGYNLGVLAAPFASYFCIPIIVTDEVDKDVRDVLEDLEVKSSIVCGDIDGYGDVLKFNNADDIVNASIEIVREKFNEIDYITITNPIDIHEPEVLDSKPFSYEGRVTGISLLPSQVGPTLKNIGTLFSGGAQLGTFKIPDDYKYALLKFEGIGKYKDKENPDEFGSSVSFTVGGPNEIFGSGLTTGAGASIRDPNGRLITDQVYSENVVYDLGGEEYSLGGRTMLFVSESADVEVNIVIEKLSDPLYPMMKKLSAIAPYLTAYHKGIILGKPEFAFVADDDKRTENDETCPGSYQPRMNHNLIYSSNNHVFWIHDQINELLAKLADVDLNELDSLKHLKDYYKDDPVYIALVGGNVVIPQIIYDNYLMPPGESFSASYGVGTPSDVIYGNIDPIQDDWSNTAKDVYGEFPEQENIIGRITGWDLQDVSAFVARTIFYNDIIDDLGDWKEKATVQTGCGTDFLKPPLLSFIKRIQGKDDIVKWDSGSTKYTGERLQEVVLKPLGFDVYLTQETESQVKGFSKDALDTIKKTNILSRLLFSRWSVDRISGEGKVKGGQLMEECNIIWQNAHGMPNLYEFGDVCTSTIGYGPILGGVIKWLSLTGILPIFNTGMTTHGTHNIRSVEPMNLGPSVMIVESCFCGKIDGMYPVQAISQAPLHAGINTYISSTTDSNVGGGGYLKPYLEPFIRWDRYNIIANIIAYLNARRGIYPDPTFGHIIYEHFYNNLGDDKDVGTAFRNARNEYLPQDWDSTFKWVPPLSSGSNINLAPNVPEHKFMAYYEYTLYGDPAFNPYMPGE